VTFVEQQIAILEQAILRHPENGAVHDAANSVHAILLDDSAIPGPWGYRSCDEWRANPGGWSLGPGLYNLNQGHYLLACEDWAAEVESRQRNLAAVLAAAGDANMAATLEAGADQTATAAEEARRNAGQLGDQTPAWVKLLLALGLGVLVLQAVSLGK
jgi:hypothetical protein